MNVNSQIMENDEFRDITTYDGCLYGLYEISRSGLLRNKITGKISRGSYDSYGYLRTNLKTNSGERRGFKIHQLVLRTFVGEPPVGKEIVNHINEVKDDNRVENLEWCDIKYNVTYGTRIERSSMSAIESGLHKNYKPSKESIEKGRKTYYTNKYPEMTMDEIFDMLEAKNRPLSKEELSRKLSDAQKKRWTPELREEKSKDMMGENNPMYGRKQSEESIRRSAEGHKKPIYQFSSEGEFIKKWDSSTDAARFYCVGVNAISNALDSKWKSCGYYWKRSRNG